MPRYSKRLKYLNEMKAALEEQDEIRHMRDSGVLSDDSLQDKIDVVLQLEYKKMKLRRDFSRLSSGMVMGMKSFKTELVFKRRTRMGCCG